jgi:hypothetical protein
MIGGRDTHTNIEVKNVIVLSIPHRLIREAAPLPHARKHLRAEKWDETVYAVGGVRVIHRRKGGSKLQYSDYSANFTKWDKGVDKWTELSDMP